MFRKFYSVLIAAPYRKESVLFYFILGIKEIKGNLRRSMQVILAEL